ncbi:MAG: hypothetical protein JNL98_34410 [Bryobacterales bacterium]|nr:hypothetical protein [Bryobacterales bacterium]
MDETSITRRALITQGTALTLSRAFAQSNTVPWYRRAYRWGQTNITEMDPERYDIE